MAQNDKEMRQVLIDAIVGRGIKSFEDAERMEHAGLARFDGNQWNEHWSFDLAALENLPLEGLRRLYGR